MHPFFPEVYNSYNIYNYNLYLTRLYKSVERYQRMCYPLIVMEEEPIAEVIDKKLQRLNIQHGEIFTVETYICDPDPKKISLQKWANNLRCVGLKKVVVSGTYYWVNERRTKYPRKYGHPLNKKYDWSGCVGGALKAFQDSGVYATPGFAVYPGRFEKGQVE